MCWGRQMHVAFRPVFPAFPSCLLLASFCCMQFSCCLLLGSEQLNPTIKVGFPAVSLRSSLWQPLSSLQDPSLFAADGIYVNISVQIRNTLFSRLSKWCPHTALGFTPWSSLGARKLWWGGGFSCYVKSPFPMFCQTQSLENHCSVTGWRY